MRRAILLLVVLLLACERREEPPRVIQRKPMRSPEVEIAPQHPLYRYPDKPRPGDPVRNPAVMPRLIESRPPEYPPEALRQRIQGIVILEVVIETDGRVSAGRVLKPLPSGLSQKAIEAVEHWRYAPGRDKDGKPVRCIVSITVNFKLPN